MTDYFKASANKRQGRKENHRLAEYHQQVMELLGHIEEWSITWIPREENTQADTLAWNIRIFRREAVYDQVPIFEPAGME